MFKILNIINTPIYYQISINKFYDVLAVIIVTTLPIYL